MNSTALTNFIGGSLPAVALRLIVISFIVGLLFVMFGFEPEDIYDSLVRLARRLVELGLSDFRHAARIFAAGAMIVLPLWLILRLLDSRRSH